MRASDPIRWAIAAIVFTLLGFMLVAGGLLAGAVQLMKLPWLLLCLVFQMFHPCSIHNPKE